MYRIVIQNVAQGWGVILHAATLDDIRWAIDEIEEALNEKQQPPEFIDNRPTTGDSGDDLWELMKELPEDCKQSDHLMNVLGQFQITTSNAHKYRESVHRKQFLIEEIRKRDRKSS